MKMEKKFLVEVFDSRIGDTDYKMTKKYCSLSRARQYAQRIGKQLAGQEYFYVQFYIPCNDGFSDYYHREDWTGGIHYKWLDEDIY